MSDGYWFKSTLFEIEAGEDDEINPGIFGRQLARWLKTKLQGQGYVVEDIINEDWGRCLMCQRTPFWLWVGVGNLYEGPFENPPQPQSTPAKQDVVWHCFVATELAFFMRLFGKRAEVDAARARLDATVRGILESEPAIELVPER
jgi:hypothetical protein